MFARIFSGVIAMGLLGACEPAAAVSTAAMSGQIGPGSQLVNAVTAERFFRSVCIDTFANGSDAVAVLKANGFVAHPETGTYYDGRRNLSFALRPLGGKDACSMVFATTAKAKDLNHKFSMIAAQKNSKVTLKLASVQTSGHAPYYRALQLAG